MVFSQKEGHKEEILCAAHCPPSLLATGSYDGEVIVWDVVSGHVQCRFVSPPPDEQQHTDGDVGPGKLTTGISHSAMKVFIIYSVLFPLIEQVAMRVLRASYSWRTASYSSSPWRRLSWRPGPWVSVTPVDSVSIMDSFHSILDYASSLLQVALICGACTVEENTWALSKPYAKEKHCHYFAPFNS